MANRPVVLPVRAGSKSMKALLDYAWLTLRHKWFVFLAGLETGAPLWRLVVHDWTKFLPSELPHYGRQFFGASDDPEGFIQCWTKHQNRHAHHWEYWIPRTGHNRCDPPYKDNEPIPMPWWAVREMMADWMGASRAYEGHWPTKDWPWYFRNRDRMRLHAVTMQRIMILRHRLGIRIKPPITKKGKR